MAGDAVHRAARLARWSSSQRGCHQQTIRAGDGVILPIDIANRDGSIFAEPDRLDIHRDAHGHIAFGLPRAKRHCGHWRRAELSRAPSWLLLPPPPRNSAENCRFG
jgi:hypothetical protein